MPVFRLTDKDGAVYNVTAPDEATAYSAFQKMKGGAAPAAAAAPPAQPAAPPAAAPPAAPPPAKSPTGDPFLDYLEDPNAAGGFGDLAAAGRKLLIGAQDVGRGAAHIAGAPFDISNMLANLPLIAADKVASLFGGSAPFRFPTNTGGAIANTVGGAAEAIGLPSVPLADQTHKERVIGDIIDFATQGLLGGAGLARATVAKVPSMMRVAPTPAEKIASAFTSPYAVNPTKAVMMDTASGVGAGAGHSAAQDMVPDDWAAKPYIDFVATLLGGAGGAGATHAAQGGVDAAKTAIMKHIPDTNIPPSAVTGKHYSLAETEAAAREYHQAAGIKTDATGQRVFDPAQVDAAKATLDKNVGEFRGAGIPDSALPTSGLLSENAGLVNAEQKARVKDGQPFIERDTAVKTAAAEKVAGVKDPTADQAAVAAAAQAEKDKTLAPLNEAVTTAEANKEAVSGIRQGEGADLAVKGGAENKANASRALDKTVVDETYVPARAEKNALFNEAQPPDAGIDVSKASVKASAIRSKIEALPESMRGDAMDQKLLDDLENTTSMTYEAAGKVRTQLGERIAAARAAGNFTLADNLNTIRRSLSESLDAAAPDAAKNYKENFAPTFRPGPGDEMAKLTKAVDRDPTRSTTPPEDTAGKFLSSGDKAAALDRVLAKAPDPAAGQKAVRDYLTSDMAGHVMNPDGTINPARARKWIDNNSDVLAKFPETKKALEDIAASASRGEAAGKAAAAELKAATERAGTAAADLERNAVGTLLRDDPRKVAKSILEDPYGGPKRLDEISKVIGADERAKAGWKAAVAEVLTDRVTTTKSAGEASYEVSFAALAKEFKRNEAVLAKVFSPEEMGNLRQAHKLLESFKQAEKRATVGSDTAGKLMDSAVGRSVQLAVRHLYGDLRGGGIVRRFRLMASMLPNNVEAVREISQMAWFNPEVASYLLGKKVRDGATVRKNINLSRLIAAEAAGEDTVDEEKK